MLERLAPLALLLFFAPAFRFAVAPGADMAMHVALARGLLDGVLSPAWPGVQPTLYPRGFSALVALLSPVGLARAGLVAAGLSYAVFHAGLWRCLAAFGAPRPRTVALLCLLLAQVPQHFFDWGGNPTALALGLGLLAAAQLDRPALAALLIAGAAAVHPLGALGAGLAVATLAVLQRQLRSGALALLAALLVAAALARFGPALSASEARWIADYAREHERLRWSTLGDLFTAAIALSAALLLARRRPVAPRALAAALGLIALLLAAPLAHVYAVRLAPLLLLPGGLLLAHALDALPLRLALPALAAAGLYTHAHSFQRAEPMATSADLQAIACLDAKATPDAVIDGAYGDATQWIPALTGRRITRPHIHVALFDEVAAPAEATHRFQGERLRYGEPLAARARGEPICRFGGATLLKLR